MTPYLKTRLDSLPCGNTLLIVGDPVLGGDPKSGLHNSLCLCDTCNHPVDGTAVPPAFIDNLLVRIHFIIVMIRWTGLAP